MVHSVKSDVSLGHYLLKFSFSSPARVRFCPCIPLSCNVNGCLVTLTEDVKLHHLQDQLQNADTLVHLIIKMLPFIGLTIGKSKHDSFTADPIQHSWSCNDIMVMSARSHAVLGKYLMRN